VETNQWVKVIHSSVRFLHSFPVRMGATGSKVDVTPALVEALVEEYKSAGGITEANTTAGCEFLNPECPPFLRSYLS
jgi:hypothetical protein